MLEGATFTTADPQYRDWSDDRRGIYTTNGALLSVVQRSAVGKPVPDLFCYAVLADFRGYKPGYSECIRKRHDCLTWVVLKGHTNNRGGSVTITSPDPRARPRIDFRYFEEGTDASGDDLRAVVEGIKLVRRMTAGMKPELVAEEELPGDKVSERYRPRAVRSRSRLGPSCVVHVRDRAGGQRRRAHRATSGCTGPRGCASSTRRSFHAPRAVHRQRDLHDRREGRRRHRRGRQAEHVSR